MSDGGKERGAGCEAGEVLEGPAGGQPSSKAQGRLLGDEDVLQAAACTAGPAVECCWMVIMQANPAWTAAVAQTWRSTAGGWGW